ncbi:reticulon-like protein B11 [Andrographis paniculata]|uniref:reticulon-like protein B11 n=1 Tax=Andrographis paniculata TaxID=175694 RepID=UPI0021E8A11F|nr:reticulon-like protein B11 [Andrographis paniculata]XP_051132546.1 reticulon-like protein B11 [Andrographis paniculata]
MGESRRFSVRQALGGGAAADLLLWVNWYPSGTFLVGSTALWYIFESAGYNLLTFISNVLLLLVIILFLWAKAATVLNRPLPPLPNLELSEETVVRVADDIRVWLNYTLSIARKITIVGDLRLLVKVAICLWLISYLGTLINLLNLIYICILLSLSLPVLYDKYQTPIDEKLSVLYHKIDEKILQKIPLSSKRKKMQ